MEVHSKGLADYGFMLDDFILAGKWDFGIADDEVVGNLVILKTDGYIDVFFDGSEYLDDLNWEDSWDFICDLIEKGL